MSDCKCDLRTRLVGDGCEQCNPGMAVEMLQGAVEDLRDEIARLRLTDDEREAVRFCVTASLPETEKLGGVAGELCRMHAATLRGLLERLGGQR